MNRGDTLLTMMERNKFVARLPCMHTLVYYDYTTVQQEHRFYFFEFVFIHTALYLPFMET